MSWNDYVAFAKSGNVCEDVAIFNLNGKAKASTFDNEKTAHYEVSIPNLKDPNDPLTPLMYDENE